MWETPWIHGSKWESKFVAVVDSIYTLKFWPPWKPVGKPGCAEPKAEESKQASHFNSQLPRTLTSSKQPQEECLIVFLSAFGTMHLPALTSVREFFPLHFLPSGYTFLYPLLSLLLSFQILSLPPSQERTCPYTSSLIFNFSENKNYSIFMVIVWGVSIYTVENFAHTKQET